MNIIESNNKAFPVAAAVSVVVITVAFFTISKWLASAFLRKIKGFLSAEEVMKTAKVFVLNDVNECQNVLQAYKDNYPLPFNFLGLDCEWVNEKGKEHHPVALLQLATSLNHCFLIRLCKMKAALPSVLKEVLEDKNILKFGVGIQDDARKLNGAYGLRVSGCVDLRHVVLRCQPTNDKDTKGTNKMGLGAICKRFLGVEMDKSWRVRCSNWEADELSQQQIEYAAHDAIVAVHLFLTLARTKRSDRIPVNFANVSQSNNFEFKRESCHCTCEDKKAFDADSSVTSETKCDCLSCQNAFETAVLREKVQVVTMSLNKYEADPTKGHVVKAEELLCDSLFYQQALSLCKGIIDLNFKDKFMRKPVIKSEGFLNNDSIFKRAFKGGVNKRKSPLYTQCQLLAPDGQMLCTLDRKKAQWYLDKEIGELTCEEPFTVKLKFEPSSRPNEEDSYYLLFKENLCVVCGKEDHYSRKNIVPHDYRRFFPDCMKDHHSHDIVLLCPSCHSLSSVYDEQLRQKLAQDYDAPLGNKEFTKYIQDREKVKVRSAGKALHYSPDKIPQSRKEQLTQVLKDYFGDIELTPELIAKAANMEVQKENFNFKCHGEVVIQKVKEQKRLLEFEKLWRVHFIETMCPQFLPDLWSVDHRVERMKTELEKLDLQ